MSMHVYKIHEGSLQDRFDRFRKKIQIYAGGYGNGKTSAAVVLKGLKIARDYPGCSILIARATYPKLNDTVRKEFLKWCPPEWIKSFPMGQNSTNTCTLTNGSELNFRYVSQRGKQFAEAGGETTSNLLSATYDMIIFDQIEDPEVRYKDFTDLMGRLRGSTPYAGDDPTMPRTGPRWFVITLNPTRNWAYRRIIKPYHDYVKRGIKTDDLIVDPETGEPMIDLIEGSTYDNASNLPSDFISGMKAVYKGEMQKRFIEGTWEGYEGLVYPEYRQSVHSIDHEQMVNYLAQRGRITQLYRVTGFDFGISAPSCFLVGVVDDLGIIHYPVGFYEPDLKIHEIQERVLNCLQMTSWYARSPRVHLLADPQIFKRASRRDPGDTTAALLATGPHGVHFERGNNSITHGVVKVQQLLAVSPGLYNPYTRAYGSPRMFFSRDLIFLHDEIADYFWGKDTFGESTDKPQDRNDHALDALKYSVTHIPMPANMDNPIIKAPPAYMRWAEMKVAVGKGAHRYG